MPDTRASQALAAVARKEERGTDLADSCVKISWRPWRHVDITMNTTSPIANGNQPPLGIFSALEENSARSTSPSGTKAAATPHHRHPQTRCATARASTVVITIVPVTAKPYAAASALEL